MDNAGFPIRKILITNGYIYILLDIGNIFIIIDQNTNNIESIALLEDEQETLYIDMIVVKKSIVFIPDQADKIVVYNTKNKEIKYINFDRSNFTWDGKKPGLLKGISYGEKIFMIGHGNHVVGVLDIKTCRMEYSIFDIPIPGFGTKDLFCWGDCGIIKNWLFFCIFNTNNLIKYDMEKKEYHIIKLRENFKGVSTCTYNNKVFVLTLDGGCLVSVDLITEEMQYYDTLIQSECLNQLKAPMFYGMFYYKDFMWLIPFDSKELVKIDLNNGRGERVYILENSHVPLVNNYFVEDNYIYFITDQRIVKFDVKSNLGYFCEKELFFVAKNIPQLYRFPVKETEFLSINNFCDYLLGLQN